MLLSVLAALALQGKGDTPPASWLTDYAEAASQARKHGRVLVIDAGREA